MSILNLIRHGKENAISRAELVARTGLSDRAVRKEIEKLRTSGNVILNLQDGRGYYRSNDPEELNAQYLINNARAMTILSQQKFIRQQLSEFGCDVPEQLDLFSEAAHC